MSEETEKKDDVAAFIANPENRKIAIEKSVGLFMMLTNGKPIEDSEDIIFTKTEIVEKTTLTHSQANNLLLTLRAFGIIEYTKGTHEFRIHFDKKRRHQTIETELLAICEVMATDLKRWIASIESDDTYSVEDRKKLVEEMAIKIDKAIGK